MEDGTIRDNETGLIWLKDANTFPSPMYWGAATAAANGLESGENGLEDGSSQGDWRLPTKSEWEELFNTIYTYPALSNTEGRRQWTQGNPFTLNEYDHLYFWSQTRTSYDSNKIYVADVNLGKMKPYLFYRYQFRAWPVREAQESP